MNFLPSMLIHTLPYHQFLAQEFLLKLQFIQSGLTDIDLHWSWAHASVSSTNKKIAVMPVGK